jgi:hypothetical protein
MASAVAALPYVLYPLVMAATFALFALMCTAGAPLVPVIFAAAAVTLLELRFPHRPEWRPRTSEIKRR